MTPQQTQLIVSDPEVVDGRARVRATRIPVSVILDCLAAGLSEDDILGQYPTLTIEGVRAAAAYRRGTRARRDPPAARVTRKLDENLPHEPAAALRGESHDIHTVADKQGIVVLTVTPSVISSKRYRRCFRA